MGDQQGRRAADSLGSLLSRVLGPHWVEEGGTGGRQGVQGHRLWKWSLGGGR